MRTKKILILFLISIIILIASNGMSDENELPDENIDSLDVKDYPMVVWYGTDPIMTFEKLAAYCAPKLWFSPDEPLLNGKSGKEIFIPTTFPFEDPADTPNVYYRIRKILTKDEMQPGIIVPDSENINRNKINLSHISAIDLDFFFYYPSEEGLGSHPHDCESAQMKLVILEYPNSKKYRYVLAVLRVVAKAHLNLWYDNTLEVDQRTKFPLMILVEEGKHGSCTDKNSDGYYTPGYDVNKRVNDAWGVRDIISSGSLYTGNYQAWMAKNRRPEHRVFPPLPEDSPHYKQFVVNGKYAPEYNVYSLRPFPDTKKAEPSLKKVMSLYGEIEWPEIEEQKAFEELVEWFEVENFVNSFSLACRMDGDLGISAIFPLFIFKHFEDPLGGGYVVNRLYFKDKGLRDIGYNLLYTPSASRWFDVYFAAGVEWDVIDLEDGTTERKTQFVSETGIKLRANLKMSSFRFLTKLGTDFWGVRIGVRNVGAWDFEQIGYVVEVGAGVW